MIRIDGFTGEFPITPNYLLPNNAAQVATDCDARYGELKPLPGALAAFTGLPTATKGAYTPNGHNIITSTTPMRAFLSPTTDDSNDRVYFTNGNGLRVSKWSDAGPSGAAVASWRVGVPAPAQTIVVEKVRKNRWPNFPEAAIRAKFYMEDSGIRYSSVDVTLTPKAGAIPFSAYTFDATINAAQAVKDAAEIEGRSSLDTGQLAQIAAITLSSSAVIDGASLSAGTHQLATGGYYGRQVSVQESTVTIASYTYNQDTGEALPASVIPRSLVTSVTLTTGELVMIKSGATKEDPTAIPSTAHPSVEVWLENLANPGERIWTAHTGSSVSAGSVTSFPGGADVTLTPTGATTYEINLTYGVIEDRAYVFTVLNDWQEESLPSLPTTAAVTYLDDVVLRIDFDAVVNQILDGGYRELDHVQFYVATRGDYVAIKAAPAAAASVTDLYHSVLGREGDAEGLAYWTAQYNAGISLAEISASMMASREFKEYRLYLALEDLYLYLLNRPYDDTGFPYWQKMFEAGMPMRDIIGAFFSSNEWINGNVDTGLVAHPTEANWPTITQIYTTFLKRAPDNEGLAYWTDMATANGKLFAYSAMINDMQSSSEYRSVHAERHVTDILSSILQRTPTAGEISGAAAKYAAGYSINALVANAASVTTDGFVDEGGNRTLGWTLPSLTWTEPPGGLEKLTSLPNGVLAGSVGRHVYFSEPYLPFAWPAEYTQSIGAAVVGLLSFEGQLLVTSETAPLLITGPHPAGMTQQRIASSEAAVSEYGVTVVSGMPVFATVDGLVTVQGTQASLDFSHKFWTSELWQSKYGARLAGIKLFAHDGKLIALFDTGDGFIVHYNSAQPHLVEFSQTGGYQVTLPGSETIYLANGSGVKALFKGGVMPYIWQSKEFELPGHLAFSVAKIAADGNVTATFFADGSLLHSAALTSTGIKDHYIRLPSSRRYLRFSVKLEGTATIRYIQIAQSMAELKNG